MNDDIKYLHLCGSLMAGKDINYWSDDTIAADNILYGNFGMSAEDIIENLKSGGMGLCVNNCK